MNILRLCSIGALVTSSVFAATIQYQVSTVGSTGTYQYLLSGFDFRVNQPCLNAPALTCSDELDIAFNVDPSMPPVFNQLSNGVAGAGFSLLLFQPNNPPQAPGDYTALAVVDHPSLVGPFSVNFTFTSGQPGSQLYAIDQFVTNASSNGNSAGDFEGAILTGITVPFSAVPEPASFWFGSTGLIIVGVFLRYVRRSPPRIEPVNIR